jgi:hypothetical protein
VLEVVTRWGDTLLEVAQVTGDHAVAGTLVVRAGRLAAAATGRVGLVEYAIRAVPVPARTVPYTRGEGRTLVPYIAALLVAHLAVWRAAMAPPEPAAGVALAPHVTRAFAHGETVPPDAIANDTAHDTKAHGQAAGMKGPAAAAGAERAIAPKGHVAIANTGEEAQLAKGQLLEQARRAGILGHAATIVESYQALVGPDKLTSGFDAASVNAPLEGGEGAGSGAFGGARLGVGDSGGASGWGTIGTGRGGAYSSGTSFGHGWSGEARRSDTWHGGDYANVPLGQHLGSREPLAICPDRARCTVSGGLDAAIVRRYVRRRISALAYCFEKALLETPAVTTGPVVVDFAIAADGKIAHASATGASEAIASCTASVIELVELPRATTPTVVSYVLVYRRP